MSVQKIHHRIKKLEKTSSPETNLIQALSEAQRRCENGERLPRETRTRDELVAAVESSQSRLGTRLAEAQLRIYDDQEAN